MHWRQWISKQFPIYFLRFSYLLAEREYYKAKFIRFVPPCITRIAIYRMSDSTRASACVQERIRRTERKSPVSNILQTTVWNSEILIFRPQDGVENHPGSPLFIFAHVQNMIRQNFNILLTSLLPHVDLVSVSMLDNKFLINSKTLNIILPSITALLVSDPFTTL